MKAKAVKEPTAHVIRHTNYCLPKSRPSLKFGIEVPERFSETKCLRKG
jgi:hypothetical protein